MDLNIRNVPEELAQAIRVKAAEEGKSMREWVIEILGIAIKVAQKVQSK